MSAVATPVIFPVPKVAASAVQKDWNWEMECSSFVFLTSSFFSREPSVVLNHSFAWVIWKNLDFMVNRMPVARKKNSIPGLQTNS